MDIDSDEETDNEDEETDGEDEDTDNEDDGMEETGAASPTCVLEEQGILQDSN